MKKNYYTFQRLQITDNSVKWTQTVHLVFAIYPYFLVAAKCHVVFFFFSSSGQIYGIRFPTYGVGNKMKTTLKSGLDNERECSMGYSVPRSRGHRPSSILSY